MGKILEFLGHMFTSAWRTLGEYLHIAIPEATAVLLNEALQLADPIVADLENGALKGPEKRDAAVSLIQAKASQALLDVGVSLIHSAIELAVLKMKATKPATPAAPGGVLPGGETVTPVV